MAVYVKHTPVGGSQSDITSSIDYGSNVNLKMVLTKEVSTFEFSIVKAPGNTIPAVGGAIDIYEDQTSGLVHIYGGTITERHLSIDGGVLGKYEYTSVDGSFKFDSKAVVKTYVATDPGNIVKDIINNFTTGFTQVNVALAGYTIPSITFNYQPPTKCLQKLASLIGWEWYIDADKDVHFFKPVGKPAPFNLDDTSGNFQWGSLDYNVSLQNLKNSVFVIGGSYSKNYTSSTTPDRYTTTAGTFIYPLGYSYDPATISVTLDGVAKTVGIDQQDPSGSFDLLYNAGSGGKGAFLRWSTDPGSGHIVRAFGNATIPVRGYAFNPTSIALYGEFQDAVVDSLITTVEEAQKRAQAEILQYGNPAYTLTFKTTNSGLMIGQNITLSSSLMGITQSFTIKRINGQLWSPTALEYSVQAVATDTVSFIDIMTLLLEQELNQNQVDSSTVLSVLIAVQEALTVSDSAAITTSTGPYVYDTAKWGFSTWG
jgi:hypothetical protein